MEIKDILIKLENLAILLIINLFNVDITHNSVRKEKIQKLLLLEFDKLVNFIVLKFQSSNNKMNKSHLEVKYDLIILAFNFLSCMILLLIV